MTVLLEETCMLRLNRLHAILTRRQRRASGRALRGMTLLEIMIVLAILALVMGFLVGPAVFKSFQSAKDDVARNIVRKLSNEAYPQWAMKSSNSGKCPTLTDLSEYMNSKDTKDPWGNEYVIKCGGDLPAGASGIAIMSKGPDGKEGSGDDIKSWE
ncbi:MAG: type II secretion system protein GspG [Kofleriaceae bacterium]